MGIRDLFPAGIVVEEAGVIRIDRRFDLVMRDAVDVVRPAVGIDLLQQGAKFVPGHRFRRAQLRIDRLAVQAVFGYLLIQ